jgi:hypothetical protein
LFKLTGLAVSISIYYVVNLILQIYFLKTLTYENQ